MKREGVRGTTPENRIILRSILPLTDQDSAGPGDPAAHRTDRLPFLPSGPGGVHRVLSHRAQPLSVVLSLFYVLTCLIPTVNEINQRDQTNKNTRLAERVGFEPTVPLLGRMLSKHVDSSTLAPLHTAFREAAS